MSRRPPNPAAEKAARNQQTIKSLLKLEPNKVCADCKRNKHPRWASWNLGVFICIRCSGIHRGMGTHISRVKSVDLDSWTDEQMQSILSWGNARANKFWEAKLAQAHVPSEAKIENFIRTKYELKRWAMDGPRPDPATLDDDGGGDDDVPLSLVKEKQAMGKKATDGSQGQSSQIAAPTPTAASSAVGDLIGGDDPVPQRSSTAGPTPSNPPPKASPAPPRTTNAKDTLLGLDMLGSEPSGPPRPASTTGTNPASRQSRPDLKQSILSLYASAPRPAAPAQPQMHGRTDSFGGMQSPGGFSPQPQQQVSTGGGLNDAFSSLSFGNLSSPKSPPKPDAFAHLGKPSTHRTSPSSASNSAFSNLGRGSFFDSKPAQPAAQPQAKQSTGGSSGFGSLASPVEPAKPAPAGGGFGGSSSAMGDLFDLASPPQASQPSMPAPMNPAPAQSSSFSSAFNLTPAQPKSPPKPSPAPTATAAAAAVASSDNPWSSSGADVWGSSAAANPAPAAKSPQLAKPAAGNFGGWGGSGTGGSFANTSIVPGASGGFNTTANVTADEEFGGWESSTGAGGNTKPAAGGGLGGASGGSDDLFSNVWQ